MRLTDQEYCFMQDLLNHQQPEPNHLMIGHLLDAGLVWEPWGHGKGYAVTGLGAVNIVSNGYRGDLSGVVSKPGQVKRPGLRGNTHADKRITD